MYTLQFTLKQHTPIIHFQHDQHGATLRATEVKPKLDRFILEKLGKEDYNEGIKKAKEGGYLKDENKPALTYSLQITSDAFYMEKIPKLYPCYFANMGEETQKKHFVFGDKIKVNLHCSDKDVYNLLRQYFSDFLVCTNFGTRQSKGFGSFAVESMQVADYERVLKQNFGTVYKIYWNNRSIFKLEEEHKSIFWKIDNEYKMLKSGLPKKKSKLRDYFNNLPGSIEWEKPRIQIGVQKLTGASLKIDRINNNYHYVRALLGLGENFEFPKNKAIIKLNHVAKTGEEKIERFQSPLTFKVFENIIYLFENKKIDLKHIKGKDFTFKYFKDKIENKSLEHSLQVPFEFNLSEFLDHSLRNSNWKQM
ncbi:MAG: hypothetical protein K1X55_10070 [Chitinophagales bacterium]|nr:hypothetical protein [Chitinophagales bacterium]